MSSKRKPILPDTLKHALISILVGACVSFLTVMMQGLIDLLQLIPAELPGAGAGMAVYIKTAMTGRVG